MQKKDKASLEKHIIQNLYNLVYIVSGIQSENSKQAKK